MLESYFQLGPLPANQLVGWYDIRLVILSYIVAVFASYIALDIASRLRDVSNTPLSIKLWLGGGAVAMGAGIWSMHFIGMLAFNMSMPMTYDIAWTALSMVVAVAASWFALFLLKPHDIHLRHIIFGGVLLGFAIAAMHYTGMAAMTDTMKIRYLPSLWLLSIIIAILASEAALWLALKSTQVISSIRFRLKIVSAFIMGAAICGMHYTGMAAAVFTPLPQNMEAIGDLNPPLMAISVAAVTFIILGIAFVVSTYKESLNQQLLLAARQAGMAEVAASVLHNVGNVLNSINVSTLLINEKVSSSQLARLDDLNKFIKENPSIFLSTTDKTTSRIPEFINTLTDYWHEEHETLLGELRVLQKHVEHVKNIIATQQDLSRNVDFEQVVSIPEIIDEALLITGLENPKYNFILIKNYEKLNPIILDKVKLLQILVNLLQNAKEALVESKLSEKKLIINIKNDKKYFTILISDNGIGIAANHITRIFAYGFTTKQSGHGFGLHTSAISAREMGGSLTAKSEGSNKGSTFILHLPCKNK